MTILETLESATLSAGMKGLSFANLQELNSFLDSFNFQDYPRNVIVPFTVNGTVKNNRLKEVLPIRGWVLRRIAQDTNDFRSVKIEPEYIDPMRVLARAFIKELLASDLVDAEVEDVTYTITAEYMFLSAHLFGVSYQINWPITGKIC